MRLLYVGTLEWGCTSLQRYEALRALAGHAYALDLRADPNRLFDRRIAIALGAMLDTGERR